MVCYNAWIKVHISYLAQDNAKEGVINVDTELMSWIDKLLNQRNALGLGDS